MLMRFMHKPLRSVLELQRASDPTRRNLLLNANLGLEQQEEGAEKMGKGEEKTFSVNDRMEIDDSGLGKDPLGVLESADLTVPTDISENAIGEFSRGHAQSASWDSRESENSQVSENSQASPNSQVSAPMDVDDDEHHRCRLVRKKLGEIVKSSLKDALAAVNRSRSLPLTPTYKLVHFGGDTDVRYFKQKDKPTAISAQNSPTLEGQDDEYYSMDFATLDEDSDEYFERNYGNASRNSRGSFDHTQNSYFGLLLLRMLYDDYYDDELNSHADKQRKYRNHLDKTHYPRVDWLLELVNVPQLLYQEKIMLRHMPVFLEQTFLLIDKKYLLGQIAVRNLSYEKSVTVRYTLDHWATIVEIPTIYVPDPPAILRTHNYDRFVFKISLELLFAGYAQDENFKLGVLTREYDLCVRFATGDCEFWDNNDSKNYRIKLRRSEQAAASQQANQSSNQSAPKQMPSTARLKQQAHSRKPKYSLSYLKRIVSEPLLSKSGTSDLSSKGSTNTSGSSSGTSSGSASQSGSSKDLASSTADNNNHDVLSPATLESPLAGAPKAVQQLAHDYNDFEQNNYYLLSPLLLSLKNKDGDDHPFGRSPHHTRGHHEKRSPLPALSYPASVLLIGSSSLTDEVLPTDEASPAEEIPTPVSPRPSRSRRVDLMTYKELLDLYCFFSTPGGNGSSTTLVLSDDPPLRYDSKNQQSDPNLDRSLDADNAFTVLSFLRN